MAVTAVMWTHFDGQRRREEPAGSAAAKARTKSSKADCEGPEYQGQQMPVKKVCL